MVVNRIHGRAINGLLLQLGSFATGMTVVGGCYQILIVALHTLALHHSYTELYQIYAVSPCAGHAEDRWMP